MFYNNLPGKWGAKQNVTYWLYCHDPLQQGGICRIDRRFIISIVGYQIKVHVLQKVRWSQFRIWDFYCGSKVVLWKFHSALSCYFGTVFHQNHLIP